MIPIKKTAFAAGLLALSTAAASAFPAVVSTDLNLRAGPSTGYQVIDVMPAGAPVEALNCGGGWCQIEYGGTVGYASQNYLDMAQANYVRPGYRTYRYERPRTYTYYERPGYRSYAYAPPNPLDFPLLPWNW